MSENEFYAKQKKLRRLDEEKAESMARYTEQKDGSIYSRQAAAIVWALSRLTSKSLATTDIVSRVRSGAELEFYYRWCCNELL